MRSARRVRSGTVLVICLAVVITEAVIVGFIYSQERISLHIHMNDFEVQNDPTHGRFNYFAPGIDRPPIHKAAEACLLDEEEIFGVEIDGLCRAYRTLVMVDKQNHIVNDLIGDRPVSVAYCNINNYVCAFTGCTAGKPLELSQGGVFSGGMVVCVGKTEYAQQTLKPLSDDTSTPAFPHEPIPLERTTWKKWRDQHPRTDVYDEAPTQ